MLTFGPDSIARAVDERELIEDMRAALLASSVTPMPLHLDLPDERAEVHVKASWAAGASICR